MFVYWLIFAIFAVGALGQGDPTARRRGAPVMLILAALLLALVIGLRYQVGGDWGAYERMFSIDGYQSLDDTLFVTDPAYHLINTAVAKVGGEIWLVNLVCGLIFVWGLTRFAATLPDRWLAMLVAVPYLIVVVAMGYTRQAVAIGLIMAGLAAIHRGASIPRFSLYVLGAALFHKTAVVGLLLVLLKGKRNLLINLLFILAAGFLLYDLLLEDSMDRLVEGYIEAEYGSQGAAIRVAMAIVPATLFLLYRERLGFHGEEASLWRNFSIAAFGFLILLFVLPSSTVVDRLALYILPLQLAVLSRVPGTLMSVGAGRVAIIAYSALVLGVWLNYAAHAVYWLPYSFYPFGG
ncbi:MAG: EpsG family protein [Sphingomonas bacterium]|nr:EpsG family protein [Sphingomonas bacterium]